MKSGTIRITKNISLLILSFFLLSPLSLTAADKLKQSSLGDLACEENGSIARLEGDSWVCVVDKNPNQIALKKWYEASTTSFFPIEQGNPVGMAFDGIYVYVLVIDSEFQGSIIVMRPNDGVITGIRTLGSMRAGNIECDGARVWITKRGLFGLSQLLSIQLTDGATNLASSFGGLPSGIAFDGEHIWLPLPAGDAVRKINALTREEVGIFTVGNGPGEAVYDGDSVWVVNSSDNSVTKLRASDGEVLGTFSTGNRPGKAVFDGANLWVVNRLDNTVTKLRTSDGMSLGTYPVGGAPFGIVYDGSHVWVTNYADDTVTKLRASDGLNIRTFATGVNPASIMFDGANVLIANFGERTIGKH